MAIRVIERVERTREHIFPVIKDEGERILADSGKEGKDGKINSFWITKYLARHATVGETLQEHLDDLRTRPTRREGAPCPISFPDPISDELLSYPRLTPRELDKWLFKCGNGEDEDEVVDTCIRKILKRWSKARDQNAAHEDEVKGFRAELEESRAHGSKKSEDKSSKTTKKPEESEVGGTNERGTNSSKASERLTSSNRKVSSKQTTQQKATRSTKRQREENKENVDELESEGQADPVRETAPKRRRSTRHLSSSCPC